MAKTTAAKETDNDGKEWEDFVVDTMTRAQTIIDELFGAQSDDEGVDRLYEYLKSCDDEDDLVADLKKAIEHAGKVKKGPVTTHRAFELFDEICGD